MNIKGRIAKMEAATPAMLVPPWVAEGREPTDPESFLWVVRNGVIVNCIKRTNRMN